MAKEITLHEATMEEISRAVFLKPFSDDRPWDETMIRAELKSLVQINAIAIVEIGKRLIFAKSNVRPGDWLKFLEEVGIDVRTSAMYMRAAQALLEMPRLKQLQAGVSKINEILRASDEDLREFEESGIFIGKKADELAAMTREELKKLIRQKERALTEREQRLEEAKGQVEAQEAELHRLRGGLVEQDVFYKDLEELRLNCLAEFEAHAKHALDEPKDPREVIAIYNLFNQLQLNLSHHLGVLTEQSSIGGLLQDTSHGYTELYLKQFKLYEEANRSAEEMGLVENGVPVA